MWVTFLGTGTSSGVPVIGCRCVVCHSANPKNRRTRSSILVQLNGRTIVVDTATDFRVQALRENLSRLDAILLTHGHADHILGLDDIRPFNYWQRSPVAVWADERTLNQVRRMFPYVFQEGPSLSSVPKVTTAIIGGAFELFEKKIIPIPLRHGHDIILGFRIDDFAYLTDFNEIPETSMKSLHGVKCLVLDALRKKPHPTHSSLENSLQMVEHLKPERAYFTHIAHDLDHDLTNAELPPHVRLAYDGLKVEV